MLLAGKVCWPPKSSTSDSHILLSNTNLQYPEKVPRVKFVQLSGLPQQAVLPRVTWRSSVQMLWAVRVCAQPECAAYVCVPGGRACLVWKCPPGGRKGTNWQASEPSSSWDMSLHDRHPTASPKSLLYKGEKSEVVLLVAEMTWAQMGTFAKSYSTA